MASSIVDRRRRVLRRRGDPRADLPDAAIAQMLQTEIEARGETVDQYAASRNDTEFPFLVREAYGEDKGYLDQFSAMPQALEGKKSGIKKGLAVGLGSIGMDETAEDLMRSARKNDREAAKAGRDVFNRLDMVDSFDDAVKYVQAGLLQAPADILPSVAAAVITRGAGSKAQKALEKSGKASDLRKKAEKYLGKDYGANVGMATGAVGTSVLENTGHVYGDLYEYTKLDPEDEMYLSPPEARAISLVAGGASGALDSALPIFLVNKLSKVIGKAPANKEVGKFFSSMPEGMVLLAQGAAQEGATEALQEVVQMLAVKYHTDEEWTDQDWNRMINGGVLGAIGGGGITGATTGLAKLLEPKYREPSDDNEYTDNFEKLKTDDERIELRNRYIDNKFSSIEIGSVVSPTGSGRLARVVETDEDNKELVIEYPGGTTERVGVTEVSIKEDAKKVIKPEEFKYLSEDKLKDLKEIRPNLVSDIDKELERRKGEKDEDTLEVEETMLVAKSRGNQITVADSSSGELVMSGVVAEDNGVLSLLSEDFSGSTDERKAEAQYLLRNQVRRKATEKGMLVSIDGVVEYELPPEAVYALDDDELLNEFGKIQRLRVKHSNNSNVIASLDFAQVPLLDEMVNAGLITIVDGKVQTTEPNTANSKFLKNNRVLGGIIGFRAFEQVEGDLDKITASTPSAKITDNFVQNYARQYVELITEGVDGITKADVNKIAKSVAVKFSDKYLKDNRWPERTEFDYQVELDLKQEEEQKKKQNAADRFDSLAPEAGKFAKTSRDGEVFYHKITEVDKEKKTIKVADLGDNSISLSDVLSVTSDYKTERGEYTGIQGDGSFRTKILVVGKDTGGLKKGKSSVEIIADDNDKITSLKSGDKIYDVSDNELSLETDKDELKKEIALLVLPNAIKVPTRVPTVDFGGGIKLGKDGIKVKSAIIKSGDGRTAREVEPIVKIVNNKAVVSGLRYNSNEYPFTERNYEPDAWKEGARQLLLKENLFPEKSFTPIKTEREKEIEKEAEFNEFDEDLSVINREKNIMPTVVRQKEYREQIDQIESESQAVKFLKGFKDILTNSTDTKVAVVLKYFRGDNEPIYLVRNLRKDSDELVVIANMNKRGTGKNRDTILTPLSNNIGGLKLNDPLSSAFYDNESGAFGEDIEGRLEIEDILAFRQNVKITKNFANREAYETAIGSYEDFVQIRSKKLSELKEWYEGEIEGTERQDDVYSLIHDGEDFNPLFEIYTESIPADILKQYRDRIVSDLVNDKETKAHKQLSHLKKKGVPLRIKDVLFVEDSTRVDQSTFTSRLAEENKQFALVQRAIRKYRERDGLVQKGENTEVAQITVGDKINVLGDSRSGDAVEETNEIRFDEPKVEEVDQDLIDRLEPIIDTLSDPDSARLLIEQYKYGETNADELTQSLFQMIQKDQEAQQESVGEIAGTEAALNREIKRHKNELRTPPINNVPLGQDLVQENEAAVQNFLGGAQMDGEPIKLSAYLQRIVMLEPGATNLDGSILDMAQTLLAHPFARNLKVKFESWENFRKGVSNDGSNGKLTRAYLRGNTIVMGPFYKLDPDSDLTADKALEITFLEEVAHRVLGTAVEVALQTKKNNQLPRGASKAISREQAIKLYDQTKELMDWLKGETDGQYYHGLLNMHEFWANFASNPRFRKFLNRPMPPAMRRKFSSKFERVIDWILDLASKIFDADFTANRTALDVIRKEYRTLLRTSDKLAANDVDIMATEVQQMESADTIDQDVAVSVMRAHQAALKDLEQVVGNALKSLDPDDIGMTKERLKEFMLVDGSTTPKVIADVLNKREKLLVEEIQQRFQQSVAPEIQKGLEGVNTINDLETTALRDTGARNLYNLLVGMQENNSAKSYEAKRSIDVLTDKLDDAKEKLARLTKPKSMFDASKTRNILSGAFQRLMYNNTDKRGEVSNVNAMEISKGLNPTPFSKLRDMKFDTEKLFTILDGIAEGVGEVRFVEQLTSDEIFDLVDIKASDVGIEDSDMDQAVQMAISIMLGSDQNQPMARSAFTAQLRLAKGRVGTSVDEAVRLIKAAAQGKDTPDVKDKSMMSILRSVRKIKEQIDEYEDDLSKYRDEYQVASNFLEAINDRIADLDEYFKTSMPLDLYEGNEYTTLITNSAGEIEEFKFRFTTGNGESSEEAKYVAARASQLMQIMQTDEYKEKYADSPMDRYFRKLSREMSKVNFGIKYQVANDGFIHSAMVSLQERFSKLGAPGKLVAEMLNKYTRDYQAEVGVIYSQGKRVSRRLKTLHGLMSKNENLNQFIQHFGSRLFDWFNERPDLAGQEEMAINKVWKHLKETDNTRNYTDDARKALRAFLKDWSIQNENFQRIYRKYDVAVEDEDVIRGHNKDGEKEFLRRRFVDQGVYTSPRRMNLTKLTRAFNAMYAGQSASSTITTKMGAILDAAQNAKQNPNFEESFTQAVGKIVDQDAAELFFRPLFSSNSVHTLPFTLKVTLDDKAKKRIITPEELDRAWRNAEGNSPGIRVANAIQNLAKIIPDSNVDTLLDLLNQFGSRDVALTKAWQETTKSEKKAETLSELLTGNRLSSSVHNRALYGVLPGEFFEYQMYDETSSGQILSSILMSSNFGENGDKVMGNFNAIRDRFKESYQTYRYVSEEIGLPVRDGAMPSKTNKIAFLARKKRMIEAMARAGIKKDFDKLDLEARAFVEARRSMAALNAIFTSRSSENEDIGLGLEVLRAISFGTVNTMKGAWTATMSIPDIGKRLGLNATSMKTIFGAYKNIAQEAAGSLLESFGVEMVRPDKYAKYLNNVFGREAGMTDFADNITEVGVRGSLGKTQGAVRRLKSIINGLSVIGAGARSKTSGNFIPASVLTPITAPFTYLAQATNKSISLSMANTIENFVLKAVDALDAKNVSLNDNLTELKPSDLGYEDSTLDQLVFGNMEMVESLNQRLTAEGMSITQLAQKYRNRKEMDPDAEVLDRDAVLAAHNIAMSEVTYDTMAGKGSWSQYGVGQFLSPLVGWSVSSYAKGMGQMRNQQGQIAMRNVIRYMLTSSAWLLPVGIAFTLFTDWWDEEILGKPSSLRKTPLSSAIPIIGLPLAMTDPRFDALAVLERAARANNILGIAQEFVSPMIIGQLDPSNMQRFDPTRRVLAISSVMNTVQASTNYLNAIKTSNKELEDFVPDYSTVVRPLMYSMGLNAVIQNAQAITNLTGIEEYDPTGFLSNERRVSDITGMRNDLRVFSKVLGMEMRSGGLFTYTATAMGNAMKAMERAAYANDKKAFKDAYRKAISLSDSSDPRKDIITKFKQRHIRYNITRFALSDADLAGMLSVMDEDNRKAIRMAIRNHEYYLRSIGGVPTVRNNNTRQYEEKLRRLAL